MSITMDKAEWMTRDLASARQVQQDWFHAEDSTRDGIKTISAYQAAFEVGGDFCDIVRHPGGGVTAFIGDVCGKGVTAALIMARVSTEFQRLARDRMPPHEILNHVDRTLRSQGHGDKFATAVCVELVVGPPATWQVANAGHLVPMLWRQNGSFVQLADPSGPPLGLTEFGTGQYELEVLEASPGDVFMMYTDGVIDSAKGKLQTQDFADLRARVRSAGIGDDLEAIRNELWRNATHMRQHELPDDAALLGLSLMDVAPAYTDS